MNGTNNIHEELTEAQEMLEFAVAMIRCERRALELEVSNPLRASCERSFAESHKYDLKKMVFENGVSAQNDAEERLWRHLILDGHRVMLERMFEGRL